MVTSDVERTFSGAVWCVLRRAGFNKTVSDNFVLIDVFAVCTGGDRTNESGKKKRVCGMCVHKQTVVSSKQRNDEIQTVFTGC